MKKGSKHSRASGESFRENCFAYAWKENKEIKLGEGQCLRNNNKQSGCGLGTVRSHGKRPGVLRTCFRAPWDECRETSNSYSLRVCD